MAEPWEMMRHFLRLFLYFQIKYSNMIFNGENSVRDPDRK
jgi:hypothetical protein